MPSRPRVLLTNGMSEGGAAAARSLAQGGFDVISCEATRWPALQSRHARRRCALPTNAAGSPGDALLALARREQVDVLLPLGAAATAAACARRAELAAITAVNVPSLAAHRTAWVKSACLAACRAAGVPCPRVLDREEARDALGSRHAEALVVKPDFDAGAALGVRYVRTPQALDAAFEACVRAHGSALIQEYIPGDAEAMRTVVVVYDGEARLAAAFTTRKLRQWPPEGGVTVAARSTVDRALVALVAPLFEQLVWNGAAEVELKIDRRDDVPKVIEVNPRFPAYLRFAAHCGLDLPLIAARVALGDPEAAPPLFRYRADAPYVSPTLWGRSLLHAWRRGPGRMKATAAAAGELRGTGSQWWELLGDPLPVFGRLAGALRAPRPEGQEPSTAPRP